MNNYAVINDGVVTNIINWDGQGELNPDMGELVLINEGINCNIGYTYSNGVFTAPPIPPADIIMANTANKIQLMASASQTIALLTDATDPDIMGDDIVPGDVELLKQWKAYRVKLSRVTDMLNPVWPVAPK